LDISNKYGGLGGIVFTYDKSAVTKIGKSENPHVACEAYKLDESDGQMVKDNFKFAGLIRGFANNIFVMESSSKECIIS